MVRLRDVAGREAAGHPDGYVVEAQKLAGGSCR